MHFSAFRPRAACGAGAAFAALGLSLVLAACSSGGDDAPPATAAPPAAAPPAAPPAVAGAVQIAPPGAVDPAWLRESAPVATLTKASIAADAAARGWAAEVGTPTCDVAIHRIAHPTTGPRGEATDASGAVFVPRGAGCEGPYPVLSYSRGTDLDRSRSMADPADRETQAVTAFFASRGYLVVASDYLGYAGSSYPYHPYLHAPSEARTAIDAIRAGRALAARLGAREDGRLFLAGYSQGGHAALATQRVLEAAGGNPTGLTPIAVGAMSGPYDLTGTFGDGASILPLLAIDLGGSTLAQAVELRLGDLVEARAEALLRDRDELRRALANNSVIGFRPLAPVLLCGGGRDPVVPFSNTTSAAADFRARGATVTVVDVEAEAAFAPRLPPRGAPLSELGSYHQGAVPPLCFAAVRDRLLEPLRR
ncbi:MAG TPA: lipase family protein [Burkholderiaceae bacterium]|nr:lipase family protein [Burkholderiaceae bacterium]